MKRLYSFIAALLALTLLFSSCSTPDNLTQPEGTVGETAPTTSAETAPKTTVPQGPDPKADDELNILLIGNSYSYYWTEELWGLLTAAGYKNATVCNVYYSGCTFQQHWRWHAAGEKNYEFFTVDKNGRKKTSDIGLSECVEKKVWDVVSFQQSGKYVYGNGGGVGSLRESMLNYLPLLNKYLHELHPNADYYFQQSWSHELGYGVSTLEEQKEATNAWRVVSGEVCKKYGFYQVPLGDAWEEVRHNPLITEGGKKTLTTRIYKGQSDYDDLTHDGDVGGGQYLNACVWFECITKKSCVGNTYRPKYVFEGQDLSLSEEKITLLQNTAHQAVTGLHGEMPAAKS